MNMNTLLHTVLRTLARAAACAVPALNALARVIRRVLNYIVNCPVTPVAALILFLLFRPYIERDGETWLYGVSLILAVLGLVAAYRCYRRKWVRRISAGVMALVMFCTVAGIWYDSAPAPVKKAAAVSASTNRTSVGTRDTGDPFTEWTSRPQECVYCSGSGSCHICDGDGYIDCGACMNGSCPVCRGRGDDCSFCFGVGDCPDCGGKGRIRCTWCSGMGDCGHCHGTGENQGF